MRQEKYNGLNIDKGILQSLSRLKPGIGIATLILEWAMIILALTVYARFTHPVAFFFVWLVIGTRMYALYSLLHDGLHYLLYPDRKVNDWIARLFLAWPLFLSLETVRRNHLAHHRYLKTEADPESGHLNYAEFQFPKSKKDLLLLFAADISGINFVKYRIWSVFAKSKRVGKDNARDISLQYMQVMYYLILAGPILYYHQGFNFVLCWVVPYITVFQALNRLRLSTEHFNIPEGNRFQTRTVTLNPVEGILLSPHNLGLHIEHHLYPSVPFYHLGKLHEQLMLNTEYSKKAIIHTRYIDVIRDFTTENAHNIGPGS